MNLERFIKDNLFSLLFFGVNSFRPLFLVVFVNRMLGVEQYGHLSVYMASIGYMTLVTNFGINTYMRRKLPAAAESDDISELYYRPLVFQLALSLVVLPLIALVSASFGWLTPAESLILTGFFVAYTVFYHFAEFYRFTGRIRSYAIYMIAYALIYISSVYLLLSQSIITSAMAIVCADALIMAVLLPVISLPVLRRAPLRLNLRSIFNVKRDVIVGFPNAVIDLAQVMLTSADRYIILWVLGSYQVGVYASVVTIGYLPVIFSRILNFATPQIIFAARDRGDDRQVHLGVKFMVGGFLGLAPIVSLTLYELRNYIFDIISLQDSNAHAVFVVVLLTAVFNGLYALFSTVNHMELQMYRQMRMLLALAALNAVSNYVLLLAYGDIVYAALTSLASQALMFIALVWDVQSRWKLDWSYLWTGTPLVLLGAVWLIRAGAEALGILPGGLVGLFALILLYAAAMLVVGLRVWTQLRKALGV